MTDPPPCDLDPDGPVSPTHILRAQHAHAHAQPHARMYACMHAFTHPRIQTGNLWTNKCMGRTTEADKQTQKHTMNRNVLLGNRQTDGQMDGPTDTQTHWHTTRNNCQKKTTDRQTDRHVKAQRTETPENRQTDTQFKRFELLKP